MDGAAGVLTYGKTESRLRGGEGNSSGGRVPGESKRADDCPYWRGKPERFFREVDDHGMYVVNRFIYRC